MTIVLLILLVLGLALACRWAGHDRFATKRRPTWFD